MAFFWEQRKFGEIVIIERGGSPRPIDKFITDDESGLNWVKIGDAPKIGNYITNTKEKIISEGLSKTREVYPGDLILSNSMSFGKPYIMGIKGCIHDGWLLIRDSNNEFDLMYLCYMLGTDTMLYQYKAMAAGSTVNNLNKELVGNTYVKYPSMLEQEQIGSFFSKLDHLITLYQRQCEILKKLKKFMLQKSFPQNGENVPEIRFSNFTDTWEQRKLGEVFNERTERAKGNEELLSVTINNGVIRQIDSDKRNIASEDKSNYKIVQIGDVPYNSMRMWQGAVGNSEYNGIVSPAYTVLVPSTNADSKFFVELFKKNSTLNIFQRWSQGLTSDTWNLKYPILSKIEFYMPMIDEQKKIGSLFSKLDNLITLHQSKCDKLKEVKKYMLQNMFM